MTDAPEQLSFGDVWWPFFRSLFVDNNIVPNDTPWPATLWTFIGIAASFLVTRMVTRYIRHRSGDGPMDGPVKDIIIGGVHIHHQVFGIMLMTVCGIWLIAAQPEGLQLNVLATLFGVGVGLAFDEFALWLHLHDVYWSPQGRVSIDAVAIVLVLTGQITVIVNVINDIEASSLGELIDTYGAVIVWVVAAELAATFVPPVVCLLKGKPITAGVGLMYIPISLIGMVRLAKPHSLWARKLYGPHSRRMRRAHHRFNEAYQDRWNRVRDLIGGAPTARGAVAGDGNLDAEVDARQPAIEIDAGAAAEDSPESTVPPTAQSPALANRPPDSSLGQDLFGTSQRRRSAPDRTDTR